MTIQEAIRRRATVERAQEAYRAAKLRYEQAPHGYRRRAHERLRAALNAVMQAEAGRG